MIFAHGIVALGVALVLTGVFAFGVRRPGPWGSARLFFLVLFLGTWAGGVWMTPVGPAIGGVYWIPFVFVGVVMALVLAAAAPSSRPVAEIVAGTEDVAATGALTALVWVLLAALVLPIFISYAV